MYENIFRSFSLAGNDNTQPSRRRFPRRANDICVLSVGENTFPVHDWSRCGVLFEADGRTFTEGDTLETIMKFRTDDEVTDIPLMAKVVRAGRNRVAFEFTNTSQFIDDIFSNIIDKSEAALLNSELA